MQLQRKLTQWTECVPEEMAKMSPAAIQYALADAKADILTMAKLLCEAGYPMSQASGFWENENDYSCRVEAPHRQETTDHATALQETPDAPICDRLPNR